MITTTGWTQNILKKELKQNFFQPYHQTQWQLYMDNASYHSVKSEKAQTSASKKAEMQDWLKAQMYIWSAFFRSSKHYKQLFQLYRMDEIARKHGHEIYTPLPLRSKSGGTDLGDNKMLCSSPQLNIQTHWHPGDVWWIVKPKLNGDKGLEIDPVWDNLLAPHSRGGGTTRTTSTMSIKSMTSSEDVQ